MLMDSICMKIFHSGLDDILVKIIDKTNVTKPTERKIIG